MALLSRSVLAASLAVVLPLLAVAPGAAYSGCAFSKLGTAGGAADTPSQAGGSGLGLTASPDTNALGIALGGLGAIAALLAGGTAVVRRHRAGAAPDLEFALDSETVVLPDTPQMDTPEAEVALAVRR